MTPNGLSFSGYVNTNGGGFCSIRGSLPKTGFLDGGDGISVTAKLTKGENKIYKFSIQTPWIGWFGSSYQLDMRFNTYNEWQTFKLPFKDFLPSFHGKRFGMPGIPNYMLDQVEEIGLMISYLT